MAPEWQGGTAEDLWVSALPHMCLQAVRWASKHAVLLFLVKCCILHHTVSSLKPRSDAGLLLPAGLGGMVEWMLTWLLFVIFYDVWNKYISIIFLKQIKFFWVVGRVEGTTQNISEKTWRQIRCSAAVFMHKLNHHTGIYWNEWNKLFFCW